MSNDAISDRRKELEEAFFKKENAKLLEKIKAEKQRALDTEAIKNITGLVDPKTIDQLLALKLDAGTIAAFTLFPLIDVAWADGAVDAKEKKAVMQACEAKGIKSGSPGWALVDGWLEQQPPAAMRETWMAYAKSVGGSLDAPAKALIKNELLGRAREVAEASGGILGMGNKVSKGEADVLAKLEQAFG